MAPPRRLDHAAILRLYAEDLGVSVDEIARRHGCAPNTVLRIARRAGVIRGVRSPHRFDHDAIAAAYAEGFETVAAIASRHGCNVTTVFDVARVRGLSRTISATSRGVG